MKQMSMPWANDDSANCAKTIGRSFLNNLCKPFHKL